MMYVAAQELEWYLFGLLYLLAAGYALLHDEHVPADIVYPSCTPRGRAGLDFVLFWVSSSPLCLLARTPPALRPELMGGRGRARRPRWPGLAGPSS